MAVGAYLRQAAAQLRSAAVQLEQDASKFQTEADRTSRQINDAIKGKELEIKRHQATQATMHDESEKQRLGMTLRVLMEEVDKHKQALRDHENSIPGNVTAKTSLAQQLHSQAAQLDSLASSADSV